MSRHATRFHRTFHFQFLFVDWKNFKKIVDFEPHYTISFCELEWFDILTTSVFSNQPNYLHYSNKDSDWLMLLTK